MTNRKAAHQLRVLEACDAVSRRVPMKLYRIDLRIAGTAYVKAKSIREAHALVAKTYTNGGIQLSHEDVCDKLLDDPALPTISLSPEATILRPYGIDMVETAS